MKTTPWTALVISNHFRLLVNKKPDFILSLAPTDAHPTHPINHHHHIASVQPQMFTLYPNNFSLVANSIVEEP